MTWSTPPNRLLHTKGSIKDLTRIAKELDDNPLQIASVKQIPGDLIHQEDIVSALKKFREEYPSKKLCIIWDSARWHKEKNLYFPRSTSTHP
jgi:hypothetical protein